MVQHSFFKDLIDVKIDVIHGSHRIPTSEKKVQIK